MVVFLLIILHQPFWAYFLCSVPVATQPRLLPLFSLPSLCALHTKPEVPFPSPQDITHLKPCLQVSDFREQLLAWAGTQSERVVEFSCGEQTLCRDLCSLGFATGQALGGDTTGQLVTCSLPAFMLCDLRSASPRDPQ